MGLDAGLRAEIFRHTSYPGMDALVATVRQEQETPAAVERLVDEVGESRWYPVEGGWEVMCPYTGQDFDPSLFRLEKGGWDHVHCEGCQEVIDTGAPCWVALAQDDVLVICEKCHDRLREAGDPDKSRGG